MCRSGSLASTARIRTGAARTGEGRVAATGTDQTVPDSSSCAVILGSLRAGAMFASLAEHRRYRRDPHVEVRVSDPNGRSVSYFSGAPTCPTKLGAWPLGRGDWRMGDSLRRRGDPDENR